MGRENRLSAVAVFPQGLEIAGCDELSDLGAHDVRPLRRAVGFQADMACLYRLHLQARLPFRLLREMARFRCQGRNSLYDGVRRALDWERWLHPSMSFRVDVTGSAPGLNHSHYSALQVKNALVDQQREIWGRRSSIDLKTPDLSLHLHLNGGTAVLSLDGSRGSLHRRGYRVAMGTAPLKENLAAGLIRLTGWDASVPLVDPCCGSGALLIEAALMALQQAPGLGHIFSLKSWADFQPELWQQESTKAQRQRRRNFKLPPLLGIEKDPAVADQARSNIAAAGLQKIIEIRDGSFTAQDLPEEPGVLVCNPPYGKRIGNQKDLDHLYTTLGIFAREKAVGWQLWLLSGNPKLTNSLHMKTSRRIPISNGGVDCRWLQYSIY
ncbi:class I SAM-dependent RNA methyltransferase [Synechococcus sp. M16CYN]|uniref:THUMP domain-containing class I SAM-dependent RNA methyltransferase n=1 Tax=Synechococcus sp. M16CYN TaxID=3103139 RepID=UPI00324EAA9C